MDYIPNIQRNISYQFVASFMDRKQLHSKILTLGK